MGAFLNTLGKIIQQMLSLTTLWFVVTVLAFVAVFLLLYGNNFLPFGVCGEANTLDKDKLGICEFVTGNKKWISLIAITSITMLIVKGATQLFTWLRDQYFVSSDKPSS